MIEMLLRQSSSAELIIGPYLDSSGVPVTSLSLDEADVRVHKVSTPWANLHTAQSLTHQENGWYVGALDSTDTNTPGRVAFMSVVSGARPVSVTAQVLLPAVWDALFSAGNLLPVNTAAAGGITWGSGAITSGAIGSGAITAAAFSPAALAGAAIADNILDARTIADATFSGGKFAPGFIGAASFLPDAITSSVLAASAVAEIQSGLATSGAAAAIQAKTDQLTFAGGRVDASLSASEHIAIAVALLRQDWAGITGEAARSVLNALRFLRNRWTLGSGALTVTKEDDTTVAWTATVETSASVDPVTGTDPS